MGRKRKPDTLTITVTRKHLNRLISKNKITDELRGDIQSIEEALIQDIEEALKRIILASSQPNTTQTNDNGATEIITYTAPSA